MSDVVTFEAFGENKAEKRKAKFVLTVKKEFLEKCPNPSEFDVHELNVKFYMFKFLHNETGPAIIKTYVQGSYTSEAGTPEATQNFTIRGADRLEFWIDGRLMNADDAPRAAKMLHDCTFKNKLDEVLNDN